MIGPSRNGKSTIVNDILGVQGVCKVSESSNEAETKGGWIAKYSTASNKEDAGNVFAVQDTVEGNEESKHIEHEHAEEIYLLDMEGLSHSVTPFTKRLFYACYAFSNVMIWNDKEVMSDRFKTFMTALKQEMESVATSDRKPSFIYLKRDKGDFKYKPYHSFDEYINKHDSFQWFRDMNIFSSLSAFELRRPCENELDEDEPLNFTSLPQNRKLLQPFMENLMFTAKHSKRFSNNMHALKQQIAHINKSTALSLVTKFIVENPVLSKLIIAPKGDHFRRRDMIYVACEFNWDYNELENNFEAEMDKLQVVQQIDPVSKKVVANLIDTKQEIYERIKNKTQTKYAKAGGKYGMLGMGAFMSYIAMSIPLNVTAVAVMGLYVGFGYLGGFAAGKVIDVAAGWIKNGHFLQYELGPTDSEKMAQLQDLELSAYSKLMMSQ
mmetsp:Transcript_10542/g.15847  ORF Transcript_10542/g.15847 Transcript_10542/m.15847 type:complete len:437 (-) Transcript_10542:9-1319(-)